MGTTPARKIHYAWFILIACIGFYALPIGIIGNTAGIFVAPVMQAYGWSQTDALMYRTIQPLVAAIFTPIAGRLMAKYDPRWLLTFAVALFGVTSIWSSFGDLLWIWNVYGVAYGISSAFFMYLAVPTLVNSWFKRDTGLVLGLSAAALSITAAIASPVGNMLIVAYGWQVARLIMSSVMTVLSLVLTVVFTRKNPESMGLLPYGTDEQSASGVDEPQGEEAGATLRQAMRSPALYILILISGLIVMAAAFFQQIPAFASMGSLGAAAGALAVTIVMIGGTAAKFVLGWLCDHVGMTGTGVTAMLCGALGIFLAFIAGSNVALFYVGMAIFGFGYAALTVINPMLARESFGIRNYPQIYSWVSTSIFLFTAVSFMVYAQIYDRTGSYDMCFMLVIGIYLLCAILIPIMLKIAKRSWRAE